MKHRSHLFYPHPFYIERIFGTIISPEQQFVNKIYKVLCGNHSHFTLPRHYPSVFDGKIARGVT